MSNRVDVQSVVNQIEYRIKVYTECIKDVMRTEQVNYQQAKKMLEMRTLNKIIFKTN
jgi:hypothetical protein